MSVTLAAMALVTAGILPGLPGAGSGADNAADEIRAARIAFNRAIAAGDIDAIAGVLAEHTVLVTGTDSAVILGRDEQLAVWRADAADPARLVYVRKTDRVTLSPLHPIAMETGTWRGAPAGNATDYVGGTYSAKWRRIGGRWVIEAETYVTTACGGALCDG